MNQNLYPAKRYLLLLICCIAIHVLVCCNKENPNSPDTVATEAVTYGGSKNEAAKAVIATADGGYAVLGHAQSRDGDVESKADDSFDVWFLKFDALGAMEWEKTYGGAKDDRGASLVQTATGYALLGHKESAPSHPPSETDSKNIWLASVDNKGDLLWEKTYGYSGNDYGTKLLNTQDGGFLIVGVLDVTASGGLGNRNYSRHAGGDYWVIKTDGQGNIQWRNYYGGRFTDTPYDATSTPDGGYLLAGSSDSSDTDISENRGSYDFWVIKISDKGDLVWEKNYGGEQIDEAHGIAPTSDGNFIIVGDTRSADQNVFSNKGGADLWVIKITPTGALLSEKTFGGSSFDVGRSLVKTPNNHWLISGSSRSLDGDLSKNNGQNDAWVLSLDAQLKAVQNQQIIGGANIDFVYDAVALQNGTVIAVGESSSDDGDLSENKGFADLLIIKTQF